MMFGDSRPWSASQIFNGTLAGKHGKDKVAP
jgi:hypothetical protein